MRWVLFTNLFWSRLDGLERTERYGCYLDLILCSLGYQGICLSSTALGQMKITFTFSSEECNSTKFTSCVLGVFLEDQIHPAEGQVLASHYPSTWCVCTLHEEKLRCSNARWALERGIETSWQQLQVDLRYLVWSLSCWWSASAKICGMDSVFYKVGRFALINQC